MHQQKHTAETVDTILHLSIYIYGWWTKLSKTMVGFLFGCVFRIGVLSEGLAKQLPTIVKNTNMFGSYRLYNGFTIPTCTFDATNTPDAFKHASDLF